MKLTPTDLPEVLIVEPAVYEDERGYFLESWNELALAKAGLEARFVQDNHSFSCRGTLRGLHYQIEMAQGKLVRVVAGEVFDVAVDLRRSSPRFGQWVGVWLSEESHRQLWIPPGFAHGFYVTSPSAHFLYKCTDYYSPEHGHTIAWDDPELGIEWPLIEGLDASLSAKDKNGIPFKHAEYFE